MNRGSHQERLSPVDHIDGAPGSVCRCVVNAPDKEMPTFALHTVFRRSTFRCRGRCPLSLLVPSKER